MEKRIVKIENIDNKKQYEQLYKQEIEKITNIPKMPQCDFYHIGATVKSNNLGEKIVDILVVVDNLHEITTFDEKRLNNIYYHRVGHDKTKGVIKYAKFNDYYKLTYDVLLYVVQRDTTVYNEFLYFESLLKKDEDVARSYNEFKEKYKVENILYSDYLEEKNRFIKNVIKRKK